jgi:hypothetical protein
MIIRGVMMCPRTILRTIYTPVPRTVTMLLREVDTTRRCSPLKRHVHRSICLTGSAATLATSNMLPVRIACVIIRPTASARRMAQWPKLVGYSRHSA